MPRGQFIYPNKAESNQTTLALGMALPLLQYPFFYPPQPYFRLDCSG